MCALNLSRRLIINAHRRSGVHYPWLLILVMAHADDDRVNPMHGRKFVAALQAADPSGVILLRTEADAAHGGPKTATAWIDAEASIYAFALAATHPPLHQTDRLR
jgi:prolyl oligopeptidase